MITHVAIIKNGTTYSLPKPNRHNHVIAMMVNVVGLKPPCSGEEQGFVTDEGGLLGSGQGRRACHRLWSDSSAALGRRAVQRGLVVTMWKRPSMVEDSFAKAAGIKAHAGSSPVASAIQ